MQKTEPILIVGEISVDYTFSQHGIMSKLRLGGIIHAARGLWASDIPYSVAVFCPDYLINDASHYLSSIDCTEFVLLGKVNGAPNITLINDVTETSHQGYEDLMRDMRHIDLCIPLPSLDNYKKVLIFPGRYDLGIIANIISKDAKISFDIAYDISDISLLDIFKGSIDAIITSTSSPLFKETGNEDLTQLLDNLLKLSPEVFLLKENRGGSRLFNIKENEIEYIPATLGKTVNSVGVGDVYSSVMVGLSSNIGWIESAWRGSQSATIYSQSTFPDDIKRDTRRELRVPYEIVKSLGGTSLTWHDRQNYSIYLAGPDFSYIEKFELDQAVESLIYHNFKVRRPIIENGELERPAIQADLRKTYFMDYQLLKECDIVFAIPLGRDPGTLVEIGMAIEQDKPVICYDPRRENENTMVIIGSSIYSTDLDTCLNGVFNEISKLRLKRK
ncbi:nucleoside 2-deoxyribosyltransferase [Aeromonas caviae]|uniref:nucleoside 2-deoxyribosyltransferase n=1 Tax=Aeromonas caviae TaxID=648 RepID=UPI002B4A3775|nr:nucleoside 2-deoxyribosyltransferase [Aeromonas caviae]